MRAMAIATMRIKLPQIVRVFAVAVKVDYLVFDAQQEYSQRDFTKKAKASSMELGHFKPWLRSSTKSFSTIINGIFLAKD